MQARTLITTAGAALALAVPAANAQVLWTDTSLSAHRTQAADFYTAAALKAMGARGQAMSQYYAAPAVRPDDRAGIRGIGEQPVGGAVTVSSSSGFDWGDAGIGAGITSGVVVLLLGGSLLATQRRQRAALS